MTMPLPNPTQLLILAGICWLIERDVAHFSGRYERNPWVRVMWRVGVVLCLLAAAVRVGWWLVWSK